MNPTTPESAQTPAPKTDAQPKLTRKKQWFVGDNAAEITEYVTADFARALECDNARLQADCERLRAALERIASAADNQAYNDAPGIARAALRDAEKAEGRAS